MWNSYTTPPRGKTQRKSLAAFCIDLFTSSQDWPFKLMGSGLSSASAK
ncbi:MAG: hypothetical protein ACK48W_07170 [Bacteroidota bacterium]